MPATQIVVAEHDSEVIVSVPRVPDGDHVDPFQTTTFTPAEAGAPAAKHSVALGQETVVRRSEDASEPADQVLPLHE